MNFSDLDGYMFEDLVVSLLKKMDFSVEQTALSGDGGIDIIAYNKQPIFKGKYLIQCKNWQNKVGQPEVRDLFGVVMSEQANKGILITTSYFTEQALQFADNKNIELIGYDVLNDLLNKYGFNTAEIENEKHKVLHFSDIEGFDKQKYTYLKSKIENNRTEKLYYDNLKNFYHSYVISSNYELNTHGLIDEYMQLNNEIIKRFCKKSKEKIAEAYLCKYINAYLYILKGELFNALEIYKDLGLLIPIRNVKFSPTSYSIYSIDFFNNNKNIEDKEILWRNGHEYIKETDNVTSPLVMLKNLYLIFNKLNYSTGTKYIETLLMKNYECCKKWTDWMQLTDWKMVNQFIYEKNNELFKQIRDNDNNKLHNIIKISLCKSGKEYELKPYFEEENFMPIEDLLNVYYLNMYEKINNELDKLNILLNIDDLEHYEK